MPINFPDSPTTGDTHTVGDKTWTWDGTSWNVVVGGVPTSISELSISNDLTVDTDTLHVDSTNDRVGIGTTSPDRGLHVDSPTAAVSAKFTSQHASLGLVELADSSSTATSQIGTNGNDIVFRPIQSERMRIDSSGRLGIGTPSPNKPLHIVYDDPTIQLTDTNTNADSIISGNSTVGSLILGADENNEVGSSQIAFKVDGVTHMGLQSTGNLEMLGGTVKGDGALVQMVTSTSGSSDLTSSADIASITMSPKYSDSTMLVMVNYHAYKYNSTGAVNNTYNLYQFGGSSIRSNPYLVYDTPSYMFQGMVSGTIAAGSTASRTYYFNVTASSSADRIYFYWKTMYVLEIAT